MIVMFHLQQLMEDDGTTLIRTVEAANSATSTITAVANDAETGNTVAGSFNFATGELNISFF